MNFWQLAALWMALSSLGFAATPAAQSKFAEAQTAFAQGNYEQAVAGYRQVIATGAVSGSVYFNLGNAYFKQGMLGSALFYYLRAQEYLPRDPDVAFNLKFVRDRATDQIENRESGWTRVGGLLRAAVSWVNLKEAVWLMAVASGCFWVTMGVVLWRRRSGGCGSGRGEWWHVLRVVLGILWLWTVGGFVNQVWLLSDYGVIVAKEAEVTSGTGVDHVVLFTLHEGAEFMVEKRLDWTIKSTNSRPKGRTSWLQIRLVDGKRGWLESELALASSE